MPWRPSSVGVVLTSETVVPSVLGTHTTLTHALVPIGYMNPLFPMVEQKTLIVQLAALLFGGAMPETTFGKCIECALILHPAQQQLSNNLAAIPAILHTACGCRTALRGAPIRGAVLLNELTESGANMV